MSESPDSLRSIFIPWLGAYLGSWVFAGIALIPIILFVEAYHKANASRRVDVRWLKKTDRSTFPDDDSGLKAWFDRQENLSRAKVQRSVSEAGETKIKISWRGMMKVDQLPLEKLGYLQPKRRSTSSAQTKANMGVSGWFIIGSLLACLGYLISGIRAWRQRAGSNPLGTRVSAYCKAAGVGVLIFGLGYLAMLGGALGALPQLAPWAVLIFFSGTLVKVLVTFVGVCVVPLSWELFFRHRFYLRAAAAGHGRRAALVSSAMFALPLILMPVSCLVLFVQGLACCAMYRRTGRLAAPLILSVVATGLAFLVFWVSPLSMVNIRAK